MRFKDLGIGTKTAIISGITVLVTLITSNIISMSMVDQLIHELISSNVSQNEKMVEAEEQNQINTLQQTMKHWRKLLMGQQVLHSIHLIPTH